MRSVPRIPTMRRAADRLAPPYASTGLAISRMWRRRRDCTMLLAIPMIQTSCYCYIFVQETINSRIQAIAKAPYEKATTARRASD